MTGEATAGRAQTADIKTPMVNKPTLFAHFILLTLLSRDEPPNPVRAG
jgi:hypothetical protein